MNAEILAVGTELLMGQVVNTNARYLSQRLAELGVRVLYHSVVGDNPQRLTESLNLALSRVDIVIMTGGLGPTKDDLTKETVAKAFQRELVLNEQVYQQISDFFHKINRSMVESNAKQAYLPEGSVIIPNRNGTAPGCYIEHDGKFVAMLPGPPKEMIPMFEDTLVRWFEEKAGQVLASRMMKVFGIGESSMENMIMDIVDEQVNPTVAPYVGDGDVVVRVTALAPTRTEADTLLEPVVSAISKRLGSAVFSLNGETMEEVLVRILKEKNLTVSVAESCTGGLIAAKIVSVPGVSSIFMRSYVVYSDRAKIEELGVDAAIVEQYGAVSSETSVSMVEGLHRKTGCDVSIAVTGIAGPDGGTIEKPVGLVYISVKVAGEIRTESFRMNGNRERIRTVTAMHAMNMARCMLVSCYDGEQL